jgi:hypothetical protein
VTHTDNLRATAPPQVQPKLKVIGGRRYEIDPKHGEELTLFGDLDGEGA